MLAREETHLATAATYGFAGSSARVRIHDWLHFLDIGAAHNDYLGGGGNGLGTIVRGLPRVARAEFNLRRLVREVSKSTLLMSREASPLSNGRLESSLLSGARRSIYDFDDATFDTHARWPKALWSKAKVWFAPMRSADVVITGNEYLAEHAAKLRADVVVIPSCVNPADYVPKSDYALAEVPTLVWAAGLPSVGSPVGANRAVLEVMGGHSATTEQEWEQSLRDLIASSDADRAALLGTRARDVISE